jgi:hypothetical protein
MTASSLKTVPRAFRVRALRHEAMRFYKFPLATKPMQMSDLHQIQHGVCERVSDIAFEIWDLTLDGRWLLRTRDGHRP